ncbi:MAG: protein kinase [Gammaproteobacteria bacterium]|jgi:serine/threonine-protein kinase
MTLEAGTRLGSYDITGKLGAGGMGEVYRATDTSLERQVAIKILPESFAADADRVARFEREAKTLASLNHANIAQVYGLERSGQTLAIVMELVDGPTLADRIAAGPIPSDEALEIALQVIDALEAAHGQGIVHRDLKPANVQLTPDGLAKLLDFGIAKVPDAKGTVSGGQSPTLLTPALTEAGVLLGTAAYMSPEQARGRAVDERADVWAFGCVLYEMLTGQPAFAGEDVTTTLARILEREANFAALPASIPATVIRTIELCLKKNPRERIRHIGDVRLSLKGEFAVAQSDDSGSSTQPQPVLRRALPIAAAVLITAVIVRWGGWTAGPDLEAGAVNRFDWMSPADVILGDTQGPFLALAPNGRRLAFSTLRGIYLREMSQIEPRLVAGTEGMFSRAPFFSPDGAWIGFAPGDRATLVRVPANGGAPQLITDDLGTSLSSVSWGYDGRVYFSNAEGIVRVAPDGGERDLVIAARDGEFLYGPTLLPDGDSILFSSSLDRNDWDGGTIVVESITSGTRTVLVEGGNDPRFTASDHLVYARGDELYAVGFDASNLTTAGIEQRIADGVLRAQFRSTPTANYGVSADGTLLYARSGEATRALTNIVSVDRNGNEEPLGIEPCVCTSPIVSPDGTRIAVQVIAPDLSDTSLWVWSVAQRTLTRLTSEAGANDGPVWTPDSRQIAYRAGAIMRRRADGVGETTTLLDGLQATAAFGYTPDGALIVGWRAGNVSEIGLLPPGVDAEYETLLSNESSLWRPALSPSGRWLAYQSNESGRDEIYVRPFPDVDAGRWLISSGGGAEPVWGVDDTELFFRSPTEMMLTRIDAGNDFNFAPPEALFDITGYQFIDAPPRSYSVMPDGERFLLTRASDDYDGAIGTGPFGRLHVVIVQNWAEDLEPARD